VSLRLGVLVLLAVLAGALVPGIASSEQTSASTRADVATRTPIQSPRPNILLITSDDQSVQEMRWLPKTRALLGKHGVTFKDMVAPHPNCCPSRAQVLTGQYAHNNGVLTNGAPNGGWARLDSATALPVWMQAAGYQTGFVGKYLHGYDGSTGREPGWNRWRPIVSKPLSRYYGITQYDEDELRDLPPGDYHTHVVGRQTREMLDDFARTGSPYFLWASYIAPHGSCSTSEEKNCSGPPESAPQYASRFGTVKLPMRTKPSFNEKDLSDKAKRLRRKKVSLTEQTRLYRARVRALATLDDEVAETVRHLERIGQLDNTVVMFTSDNGYMFGEHRRKGKVLAYEESIRVPLLVRGPGVPAGQVRKQTVAMIDLAPTFAALAGATPMVRQDGSSLWRYATRNVRQADRALLVQAGTDRVSPRWQFRGVRTARYTYVAWPNARDELYDRRNDPYQLHSQDRSRAYAAQLRAAKRILKRLGSCRGASCRIAPSRTSALR
jgi:arylsulfatase A-like enzyme